MNDTIVSATGKTRLDRRGFLRRSTVGFAIPATLAALGVQKGAAAQSAEATPATPAPEVESGYAFVNGLDHYYEILGSGDPLILVHGGLSTIGLDFGALRSTLAQSRQTIGVELQARDCG
jgi:hypothetical protein